MLASLGCTIPKTHVIPLFFGFHLHHLTFANIPEATRTAGVQVYPKERRFSSDVSSGKLVVVAGTVPVDTIECVLPYGEASFPGNALT